MFFRVHPDHPTLRVADGTALFRNNVVRVVRYVPLDSDAVHRVLKALKKPARPGVFGYRRQGIALNRTCNVNANLFGGYRGFATGRVVMNSLVGVAIQDPDAGYRSRSRPEVMALLPPLKTGLKVLEVGCGEGAFSMDIPGTLETWGIEPDPRSAEIANTRLSKVFVNTFDAIKAKLPGHYFDLVVCNDVIEHMTDHDAFLRSIQVYMAPGAYLVGSLPNVRFYGNLFNLLVAGDWHYQEWGILDRTHFRFFTMRSVRRSLEQTGFKVQRLDGLNEDTRSRWDVRTLAERLFRRMLIVLSAGAARDIKYVQIGFLAISGQ